MPCTRPGSSAHRLCRSSNSLVSVRMITTYPLLQWVPFAVYQSVSPLRPYKTIYSSVLMMRPKICIWFAWNVNCLHAKWWTTTARWADNKFFTVIFNTNTSSHTYHWRFCIRILSLHCFPFSLVFDTFTSWLDNEANPIGTCPEFF